MKNILICALLPDVTRFKDNKKGKCSICKKGIYFRPHIPTKNIRKLCWHCGLRELKKIPKEKLIIGITSETKKELREEFMN